MTGLAGKLPATFLPMFVEVTDKNGWLLIRMRQLRKEPL
jgi:hypothetical protein